ncbi:MAG: hypothetical protein U0992_09605 [Planctomycetaceae bacterium]
MRKSPPTKSATALLLLLLVVRSTPAVDRLYEDLKATCRRELLGCPDDAAKLAISAVARGEANSVIILAAQTHRAACPANRHDAAKAVAVRNAAADVASRWYANNCGPTSVRRSHRKKLL